MAIHFEKKLPIPAEVKKQYPLSPRVSEIKARRDQEIRKVFTGEDDRFVVIIGPCSADNEDSVCDYINRLATVQDKVGDRIIIIPRIYTNKPRTTGQGYKGMIYGNYRLLTSNDFSGILTRGGTIIGSSRQPFKLMRVPDANGLDKVAAMKQNYYKLRLDCVVILGGNGTQKTANLLREEGLNVIQVFKFCNRHCDDSD